MSVASLSVTEARRLLEAGTPGFVLLDVREAPERALATVAGSTWIPLGELGRRLDELPRDAHVAVLCHHGFRSARAAAALAASGWARVSNVVGGIEAWSLEADPTVPRYR